MDTDTLAEDGFTIRTEGARLAIVGGSDKGTLYGVYSFFDQYLGYRCLSSKVFDYPKLEQVKIEKIDDTQVPVNLFRDTHYRDAFDPFYSDWHKIDHSTLDGVTDGEWGYMVHSFELLVPPAQYFKTHPEYYALVEGVLSFPKEKLTANQYEYFNGLLQRLPEIPTIEKNGRIMLPPAESWELEGDQPNMEFPQLYTLFPFETYSFDDTAGLNIAKNTWLYNSKASAQKNYIYWFQGGVFAAHLGLTDEAKSYALNKFLHPLGDRGNANIPVRRFPAFWDNPGFDQCPDIDHGGAGMIGLQDMLMQTKGKHIYLLPAWPMDWDCDFKLHAPYSTIIEGTVRNGKLVDWNITPSSRKEDVIIIGEY